MTDDWTPAVPKTEDWTAAEASSPVWKRALRFLNLGSRGVTDVLAEMAGGIPDAVGAGLRAVGLPSSEPGAYTTALKEGMAAIGNVPTQLGVPTIGPAEPQTTGEKAAYMTGRGIGGATSVAVPAGQIARLANTGTATRALATSLAQRPISQMMAGGVGGAVEGATDNPWLGFGASMATPFVQGAIRRAVTPFPSRLSAEQRRLLNLAQREGIPTSTGQESGSRALQTVESVLDDMPFSAGMGQDFRAGQQAAFNRAVLRRAGITADVATPDVLDRAARQLGARFDSLSRGTLVRLRRPFERSMANASARYGRKLPSQQREVFQSYWDDIAEYASRGEMPGEVYQQTRSDLGRQIKAYAANDPALSIALRGIRDALDDAMADSIPANMRRAWTDVRRQYSALKTIMNTVSRPSAGAAAGDISGASLWTAAKAATTKDRFARGAGDLNDLARVGQAFVKPQIANSGTSQRRMWMDLLSGTVPMGTAGYATGGDPVAMVAAGTAGLSLPPAVRTFMESPAGRTYLLNQLLSQRIQPVAPSLFPTIALGREAARNEP